MNDFIFGRGRKVFTHVLKRQRPLTIIETTEAIHDQTTLYQDDDFGNDFMADDLEYTDDIEQTSSRYWCARCA